MSLRYAVLGLLEAKPMSGYELVQLLSPSTGWLWSAPQSQIYPLLKRLTRDGSIEGEEEVRGERLRRVRYSLTPEGLEELRGWLRRPMDDQTTRDAQLLQVELLDLISPDEADAVLRDMIETLTAQVEGWSARRRDMLTQSSPLLNERLRRHDPADHDRIASLKAHVFDYLIDAGRTRIAWAEEARAILSGSSVKEGLTAKS